MKNPLLYSIESDSPKNFLVEKLCTANKHIKNFMMPHLNSQKIFKLYSFILVPPKDILVFDSKGDRLYEKVGPIIEGSDLDLSCIANGGKTELIISM